MPSQQGPRDIIVADNDYIIRDILRSMLQHQGFRVLLAIDGLEALDLASRTVARCVILDLKMPKLDGIATCAQLRGMPGYANVPIAMLSAFNTETTREAAREAGATTFLGKPFKSIDLLRELAVLLPSTAAPGESAPFLWARQTEPEPVYGEPFELSEGRRVLNIYRR